MEDSISIKRIKWFFSLTWPFLVMIFLFFAHCCSRYLFLTDSLKIDKIFLFLTNITGISILIWNINQNYLRLKNENLIKTIKKKIKSCPKRMPPEEVRFKTADASLEFGQLEVQHRDIDSLPVHKAIRYLDSEIIKLKLIIQQKQIDIDTRFENQAKSMSSRLDNNQDDIKKNPE